MLLYLVQAPVAACILDQAQILELQFLWDKLQGEFNPGSYSPLASKLLITSCPDLESTR
jgi:hypothetical protein